MFDAIYNAVLTNLLFLVMMEVLVPDSFRFSLQMWGKRPIQHVLGILILAMGFWMFPISTRGLVVLGMSTIVLLRAFLGREFADAIRDSRQFFVD